VTVHVINMDRDQDRLRTFMSLNDGIVGIERFAAINGNLLDRAALIRDGVMLETCTYSNGFLGSAMSHTTLWRRAIAEDSPITVVEDDVVLAPNFAAARDAFLPALPADWAIVLWGWNFNRPVWAEIPEGVAKAVLNFDQDELRTNIETFRHAAVAHAPVRLRHAFGIPGYTISPLGARAMLEGCLPLQRHFIKFESFGIGIPNNGLDCMMQAVYPKLKSYVCMPPLVVAENREEESRNVRGFE
jgi:glycosyl transferase, family 25